MILHEALAGALQGGGIIGGERHLHGFGREPPAQHGVVDALARGGGDDTGAVTRQDDISPVVPLLHGLHRNGRTLAPDGLDIREAILFAHHRGGAAQREALLRAAGADARRIPVREDPGVEIGRGAAVIDHVAALAVEAALRRLHDLVIGEDAFGVTLARNGLHREIAPRAIGHDHHPRADALETFAPLGLIGDDGGAVRVALQVVRGAADPFGASLRRAFAQPFVELAAIHHADIPAVLDGHVHAAPLGRDDLRVVDLRLDQVVGDGEVADRARRDRSATGLDAPRAVQHGDAPAGAGQVMRRRRARWPAADDQHIIGVLAHERASFIGVMRSWASRGTASRVAINAERTKRPASPRKTAA